jgi:hypothetical protein
MNPKAALSRDVEGKRPAPRVKLEKRSILLKAVNARIAIDTAFRDEQRPFIIERDRRWCGQPLDIRFELRAGGIFNERPVDGDLLFGTQQPRPAPASGQKAYCDQQATQNQTSH